MKICLCGVCFYAVRVLEDPSSLIVEIPRGYECPDCFRTGTSELLLEASVPVELQQKIRVRDLTSVEAFTLLSGGGFPEDQIATPAMIREAFKRSPVAEVGVDPIRGSEMSVIKSIFLEDGTRIYLASGPMGAVVYRMAKKAVA